MIVTRAPSSGGVLLHTADHSRLQTAGNNEHDLKKTEWRKQAANCSTEQNTSRKSAVIYPRRNVHHGLSGDVSIHDFHCWVPQTSKWDTGTCLRLKVTCFPLLYSHLNLDSCRRASHLQHREVGPT